jgi:hypothetical protein
MDSYANYDRPSAYLLALEVPLAALNMAALAPAWALLQRAPQGDGHPVLVLPGLGASDVSTRILRRYLRSLDYHVHAWRLGRNFGPTAAAVDRDQFPCTQWGSPSMVCSFRTRGSAPSTPLPALGPDSVLRDPVTVQTEAGIAGSALGEGRVRAC